MYTKQRCPISDSYFLFSDTKNGQVSSDKQQNALIKNQIIIAVSLNYVQGKRMNAKFLFFSNVYLLNKIILAVFRRIC